MDIEAIVSKMTLEEKCDCLTGSDYWTLGGCPRLGVAPLVVADGPHGLRKQPGPADNLGIATSDPAVCFPTASASACSFDIDLMRRMGEAIGDEAREQQVDIVLGPGVNMKRSPLCGRNFEYFSEDPHLAGELAAAYVEGVQSRGVGTSLKHFAANSQETNRLIVDSVIDERALHELYLEPFRIAIEKAHPWTVMTAYNLVNGVYCSENSYLMDEVARGLWGFAGAFITDWGAENDNAASIPAGLDLVMPGPRPDYRADVRTAVESGALEESLLDKAVERILKLHERCERHEAAFAVRDAQARLSVAREVAEGSAVLVKNDGVLPLAADASIALIGAFAEAPRYQGTGSSKINPVALCCAREGFASRGATCAYAQGYDRKTGETDEDMLAAAVERARSAEVAVVFVGLPDAAEAEGSDRADMGLPDGHNRLVAAVCDVNPNTVVVVQGGAPVELPWRSRPSAILLSYLAGCEGGSATAAILFGDANPSGKLAETWPDRLADVQNANSYPAAGRQALYTESVYAGYRYYDAAEVEPAYPFGFGLSYTTFAYSDLSIEGAGEGFDVSCTVRNSGTRKGAEVVQLYVAPVDPCAFMVPQQLKGFAKVSLEPGEEKRITMALPHRAFAHYDAGRGDWIVEGGCYEIRVSASSRDVRLGDTVLVPGEAGHSDGVPDVYRRVEPGCFTDEAFLALYGRPLPKVLTAMRPYTANATVGDLRTSLIGRLVQAALRRELKTLIPDDKEMRAAFDRAAMDTPLRAVAMSGIDMNVVKGVVDILNYRFIRGIKRLRAVNSHAKDAESPQGERP